MYLGISLLGSNLALTGASFLSRAGVILSLTVPSLAARLLAALALAVHACVHGAPDFFARGVLVSAFASEYLPKNAVQGCGYARRHAHNT